MTLELPLTDRAYFEAVFLDIQEAWNSADGAAYAAPFTEDADFINIFGMHGKGRAAIAEAHNQIFHGVYTGSMLNLEIRQSRLLTPDVALVHLAAHLRVPAGPLAGEMRSVPSAVLVRRGAEWRIAAFHNTLVNVPPGGAVATESR